MPNEYPYFEKCGQQNMYIQEPVSWLFYFVGTQFGRVHT